jgi:hypothetical protein
VRRRSSYLAMISSLIAALALLCSSNGANGAATALGDYRIWGVATQSATRTIYPFKALLFRSFITASLMGTLNDGRTRFDERFLIDPIEGIPGQSETLPQTNGSRRRQVSVTH